MLRRVCDRNSTYARKCIHPPFALRYMFKKREAVRMAKRLCP